LACRGDRGGKANWFSKKKWLRKMGRVEPLVAKIKSFAGRCTLVRVKRKKHLKYCPRTKNRVSVRLPRWGKTFEKAGGWTKNPVTDDAERVVLAG